MVRVEDFALSEPWLQHQLGIRPLQPRFLHTLPSCNTWLRGTRTIECCLPAPYTSNRRPPIVTHKDDFVYYLPSEGCPAQVKTVILDRAALGGSWVAARDASHPTVHQSVQDRAEIKEEIIRGPLVVDFRPAPELPRLQAEDAVALAALVLVQGEVKERWDDVQACQCELAKALVVLGEARQQLTRMQDIHSDCDMHVKGRIASCEEVAARLFGAERELSSATTHIVEVAGRVHSLMDEQAACMAAVEEARLECEDSRVRVMSAQAHLNSDLVKYNRAQDFLERAEVAHKVRLPLLHKELALSAAAADALLAEQQRAAESLQLADQVEALAAQVLQKFSKSQLSTQLTQQNEYGGDVWETRLGQPVPASPVAGFVSG